MRLSYRFPLSCRGVEELLFERGVVVSDETIRRGRLTFGPPYATEMRRCRPPPKSKWHRDELFIMMNGKRYNLWRAVDAEGMVRDILVQERRNQEAAEAFLQKRVASYPDAPRVAVTEKRASYAPALKGSVRTQNTRCSSPTIFSRAAAKSSALSKCILACSSFQFSFAGSYSEF